MQIRTKLGTGKNTYSLAMSYYFIYNPLWFNYEW